MKRERIHSAFQKREILMEEKRLKTVKKHHKKDLYFQMRAFKQSYLRKQMVLKNWVHILRYGRVISLILQRFSHRVR